MSVTHVHVSTLSVLIAVLAAPASAEDRALTEEERLATLITNAALRVFKQLLQLARKFGGKVFPTYS